MNIFKENNYKKVILKRFEERKKLLETDITFTRIAESAGVQKTYFSKMLKDELTHLNSDQLYLTCQRLQMQEEEIEYVQLLLERDRTQVKARKMNIQQRIDSIRKARNLSDKYIKTKHKQTPEVGNRFLEYFLDPMAQLIFVYFTIKAYRNSPRDLITKLEIEEKKFTEILNLLNELELISVRDGRVIVNEQTTFLPSDSKFGQLYTMQMRDLSYQQLKKSDPSNRYSLSLLFSADEGMLKRLRERFLAWLEELQQEIAAAEPTDVFQLNFDLVPW